MGRFDSFIARPIQVKITNDDGVENSFDISPLPFRYMGDIFELMRKMTKAGVGDVAKRADLSDEEKSRTMLEILDKETITRMGTLVIESLKISYPKEDPDKIEAFASKYLMNLFSSVMEVNSFGSSMEDQKKAKIASSINDKE